ncbi:MAG: hypothetical protein GX490_07860, partial [Bacilli bacterium]|nr:hypothetical protein [Bacilli bacterium]
MFTVNLKKEWVLNKSLLISFFIISLGSLLLTVISYVFLKYVSLPEVTSNIIWAVWNGISALITMVSSFFPLILVFFVLRNDLGKNHVHYTIFTPQSILSWYLPKFVFCLIIQTVFSLINLTIAFLQLDLMNLDMFESFTYKILTFLSSAFSLGTISILTLSFALYYSFRKELKAWFLIILSIGCYYLLNAIPTIVLLINQGEAFLTNPSTDYILG